MWADLRSQQRIFNQAAAEIKTLFHSTAVDHQEAGPPLCSPSDTLMFMCFCCFFLLMSRVEEPVLHEALLLYIMYVFCSSEKNHDLHSKQEDGNSPFFSRMVKPWCPTLHILGVNQRFEPVERLVSRVLNVWAEPGQRSLRCVRLRGPSHVHACEHSTRVSLSL